MGRARAWWLDWFLQRNGPVGLGSSGHTCRRDRLCLGCVLMRVARTAGLAGDEHIMDERRWHQGLPRLGCGQVSGPAAGDAESGPRGRKVWFVPLSQWNAKQDSAAEPELGGDGPEMAARDRAAQGRGMAAWGGGGTSRQGPVLPSAILIGAATGVRPMRRGQPGVSSAPAARSGGGQKRR